MTPVELPRIQDDLEHHRAELTRYCTRMLGSRCEAEDAVQETLLRAWRGHGQFEGRSTLRPWMYRIATNVCLTMLKARARRAVPIDPETLSTAPLYAGRETDPAEQADTREGFRLALLAGLERLPPRQRAVLLLRDVLSWRASEVAELLATSTAAVNSALQRARASLGTSDAGGTTSSAVADSPLLASYLADLIGPPSSAANPRSPGGERWPAAGHVLAGRDRGHVPRRRAQPHQEVVEVASLDRRPAARITPGRVPLRGRERPDAATGRPAHLQVRGSLMQGGDSRSRSDGLSGFHADRDVLDHVDVLSGERTVEQPVDDHVPGRGHARLSPAALGTGEPVAGQHHLRSAERQDRPRA